MAFPSLFMNDDDCYYSFERSSPAVFNFSIIFRETQNMIILLLLAVIVFADLSTSSFYPPHLPVYSIHTYSDLLEQRPPPGIIDFRS
jgi:hypothetical protein